MNKVIQNKYEAINVACFIFLILFLTWFVGYKVGEAMAEPPPQSVNYNQPKYIGSGIGPDGPVTYCEPTYFQKHVLGQNNNPHPLCR